MMVRFYIEPLGVAGSGKTTVLKVLVSSMNSAGLEVLTRKPVGGDFSLRIFSLYNILRLVLRVPMLLSLFLLKPRSEYSGTPYIKRVVRDLVLRLMIDSAVLGVLLKRSNATLVNDEGLLAKLISLKILTNMRARDVLRFTRLLIPKETIFLNVKTNADIALNRESKRDIDLPFFSEMRHSLKKVFFQAAALEYDKFSREIQLELGLEVLSVDNSGSYENMASNVNHLVAIIADKYNVSN